jgi:Bifunctional DNA primase/polymerase, N-terminal
LATEFQERGIEPDPLAVAIQTLIGADAPHVEVALAYCRQGIPVFPLRADTKSPFMNGGHHLATIDQAKIGEWWREWPNAMVGIPAGPPSGVWVVDLDERAADPKLTKPLQGITALRALGFEPCTVARCIVETPSAGLHLAFRLPPGLHIPNRAGDIASGIDVRGTTRLKTSIAGNNADRYKRPGYNGWPQIVSGGYFVAAGSKRADGRRYAFKAGSYLSAEPAPLELLRLALFNRKDRRTIEADPELRSRLASAEPQRWTDLCRAPCGAGGRDHWPSGRSK